MNKFKLKYLAMTVAMLVIAVVMAGCHDDDSISDPNDADDLGLKYDMPVIERFGRYYTLPVSSNMTSLENIDISCSDEWLHLSSKTVPTDGIIEFCTDDNDDVRGRTAIIRLAEYETGRTQILEVYQMGEGDYQDNSAGDLMSDFGVGWGYNAFDEYQSRKSIRGKIIDVAQMGLIDSDSTFQSVQEVIRSSEEFEIISAYSMQEMASHLTKKMEQTSSFMGGKKTIKRMQEISKYSLSESYMAYARLYKIVASKSVDRGVIEYLVTTGNVENLPFSPEFKEQYQKILKSDANSRAALIKSLLNNFGTHLIIEGIAGGSIDYVVTFSRDQASEFENNVETQCKKVFGKITNSSSSSSSYSITSSMSNENTFSISGGSSETRTSLKNAISGLSSTSALPNDKLQQWLNSVYYSPGNKKNLDIVDFEFIPIWDLFADQSIKNEIFKQISDLSLQSNNSYTDKELGTDNYQIDLTISDFNFDSSGNGSLVKVLYYNGVQLLEICSEYVPKIRSDKRITVFYPIQNGRASHSQGLFPGDGEGNRPAFLTFYDGDCYVNPIDGYGYKDKLTNAYLMHGNIYEQNYQVVCSKISNFKVLPHQLQFAESDFMYDVVKIGSGYWTRCNIKESMNFGYRPPNSRTFTKREKITKVGNDNMLFAYVLDQHPNFIQSQPNIYGSARDKETDLALLWYLPTKHDKEILEKYIGNNTKPLFKGGVTGFDAQFCGYFETGKSTATDASNCYIVFKESVGSTTGYSLILTPNYDWTSQSVSGTNKMYPVRLYRSRYFTYKNI
ncbi:MAC/perforin domain-containing protein [Bacteroides acidifaciens]|uniref:MAC/perforin domain-containing protein n=1 Tax=Bacteroides acidifaciens TaxID=85831 RepID=UPI0025B555E3|nr:MAC/perforin domain-containing protein [Bacteroides acidifaciens]